jgi:hypothetical protein
LERSTCTWRQDCPFPQIKRTCFDQVDQTPIHVSWSPAHPYLAQLQDLFAPPTVSCLFSITGLCSCVSTSPPHAFGFSPSHSLVPSQGHSLDSPRILVVFHPACPWLGHRVEAPEKRTEDLSTWSNSATFWILSELGSAVRRCLWVEESRCYGLDLKHLPWSSCVDNSLPTSGPITERFSGHEG